MTSHLIGSDFTGAVQLPNYVNGRLLTAEDLATSQATLRARDRRLGQAAGNGVVDGLWVTSTATTLTVAPGLGVAPSGDTVSVAASVTLPLTFAAPTTGSSGSGLFSCCAPTPATGGSAITAGCYLLTALPACQLTGQAPLASAPDSTTPAGCAAQWQVEGVQFKAIALPLGDTVLGIPVTDDNRRTLLAHWCFGSPQLATLGADPFGFVVGYGGFDMLDPADLSTADLPLGVFYWNGQAVGFVDNWSARRRITAPDPVTASWSGVVSDRRTADGQARLLQFQDQAAELIASGAAATTVAATTFPLLPPVGFLPIGVQHISALLTRLRAAADKIPLAEQPRDVPGDGQQRPEPPALFAANHEAVLRSLAGLSKEHLDVVSAALAAKSPQPGFDLTRFFGSVATWGGVLDWEIADFALRQSWENAPAATTPPPARDAPAPLMYFLVLQNVLAGARRSSGAGPGLYVVFVKNYTWLVGSQLPFVTSRSAFGLDAVGG